MHSPKRGLILCPGDHETLYCSYLDGVFRSGGSAATANQKEKLAAASLKANVAETTAQETKDILIDLQGRPEIPLFVNLADNGNPDMPSGGLFPAVDKANQTMRNLCDLVVAGRTAINARRR